MKIYPTILFCLLLLSASTFSSEAQVFKKIGKSVGAIARAAVSGDDTDDNREQTVRASHRQRPAAASEDPLTEIDYESHQINVVHVGVADERNGEYFIEAYSSVSANDNQLLATVIVGVMTEQEQLSELGEGSDADVAIIYKNGKKITETSVGNLDPDLRLGNTAYDWYPIKDETKGNTDNAYIKPDVAKNAYEIVFNRMHYGPYLMISNMIVNKTKDRFYASVSPMLKDLEHLNTYLISNNGKPKPIDFGGELLANTDFSNGCTIVPLAATLAKQLQEEKNESKQRALQEQLTNITINYPNNANVTFFTGKKLANIYVSSPWLNRSGSNIFTVKSDESSGLEGGVYLNGLKIADAQPRRGQAWCNADGTNWAYEAPVEGRAESALIFKDGTEITQAIHPRHIVSGTQNYIVWFGHDNRQSNEIRMFSKAL